MQKVLEQELLEGAPVIEKQEQVLACFLSDETIETCACMEQELRFMHVNTAEKAKVITI